VAGQIPTRGQQKKSLLVQFLLCIDRSYRTLNINERINLIAPSTKVRVGSSVSSALVSYDFTVELNAS